MVSACLKFKEHEYGTGLLKTNNCKQLNTLVRVFPLRDYKAFEPNPFSTETLLS